MTEEYRDIEEFEGKYQVSNLGNVRRLEHKVKVGRTMRRLCAYQMKIRSYPSGYQYVTFAGANHLVHRLVATVFIDNPNHKPVVNHKDYNPSNNRADNLEWVTTKENLDYSYEHRVNALPRSSTGERFIYYRKRKSPYLVHIQRGSKNYQRSFKTLEEAIKERDRIVNELNIVYIV